MQKDKISKENLCIKLFSTSLITNIALLSLYRILAYNMLRCIMRIYVTAYNAHLRNWATRKYKWSVFWFLIHTTSKNMDNRQYVSYFNNIGRIMILTNPINYLQLCLIYLKMTHLIPFTILKCYTTELRKNVIFSREILFLKKCKLIQTFMFHITSRYIFL